MSCRKSHKGETKERLQLLLSKAGCADHNYHCQGRRSTSQSSPDDQRGLENLDEVG